MKYFIHKLASNNLKKTKGDKVTCLIDKQIGV